jgi:DNA-binding beta-propeller fold protein YncE
VKNSIRSLVRSLRGLLAATVLAVLYSTADGQIYVADSAGRLVESGTISEFSTSGTLINPWLITGLNGPSAITVSGSNPRLSD